MRTSIGCDEFHRNLRFDRRSLLKYGALGVGGLQLAGLLRREAQAAAAGRDVYRDRSVIILWMRGGPSQHDMWDPKPQAPLEIRGEFAPISTSVPGVQLGELLPKCAKIMHKWSIVRSLHHRPEDGNVGHSNGDQICFTGYPAGSQPDMNVMPSCGSIVAQQQGDFNRALPSYVMIPGNVPGTSEAWLGPAYRPFETGADPANPSPFRVRDFGLSNGITAERLADRGALLDGLDRLERSGPMAGMDAFQTQAVDILSSRAAMEAFNLEEEPSSLREQYGMMPSFDPMDPTRCGSPNWAQRMLLARRLVESGVRLVTVDCRWWDFHVQGFDSQRRGFLPRWDQAYTALLADLEQRGLLANTLVVAWGEIGRTPRINNNAGRDHWPYVFSAAFAGGKVQGGRVVGASDNQGAYPKDNPKLPHDVLATIYDHLGIDTSAENLDLAGRPRRVLAEGAPIRELF